MVVDAVADVPKFIVVRAPALSVVALAKLTAVLLTVKVPDDAPIPMLVALLKALMVVAVASKTENVVDDVPIEVTKVGLVFKTTLPVPVDVVVPVPPLDTFRVPAKVTAPMVAVAGVKPVVPAENELTTFVTSLKVEYHWVLELALNSIHPLTVRAMNALADIASIAAPDAGYTLTVLAPLLTMISVRPTVAVGRVTPEGLDAAVVITV